MRIRIGQGEVGHSELVRELFDLTFVKHPRVLQLREEPVVTRFRDIHRVEPEIQLPDILTAL